MSLSPAGAAPTDPSPGPPETERRTAPPTAGGAAGAAAADDEVLAEVARFQAARPGTAEREAAFRRLFERFHRPVERFFARRGVAPEDCRDLTQEVLLGIYRGLDGWRPEARFSTWVFHIAATTYLKQLRSAATAKRRGHEVPVEDVEPAQAERQLEAVLGAERQRALRAAVAELPDAMRRCLLLRLDQDLRYREIAAVLRISPETVKAHLFQARRRLGEQLAGWLGEPEETT
ncbi:MAG TPA: RNA polymerase sigma factor [Thermoanaerobaculia bacterium]|nr:RNA polymerase sigma factor [Thermoanaerobaculia bacterium]